MSDQPSLKHAADLLYHLKQTSGQHTSVDSDGLSPEITLLRAWQSERLAQTHADLVESQRYGPACRFFLSDIYAPRDFSQRDHDIERMYDFMRKFIPMRILRSLALAVELKDLTNELDQAMVDILVDKLGMTDFLSAKQYTEAYRLCDNYEDRLKQIDLIIEIGSGLSRLARLPLIGISLRLARGPAHQAGWFQMQDFLERGLDAFKQMKGAKKFLDTVEKREKRIMDQIFAGAPDPFAL